MPEIGDTKTGKEFGYKNNNTFIWQSCEICGKERWVRFENNKPQFLRCFQCANRHGAPKEYTCMVCGVSFIAPNHNHRLYCEKCSLLRDAIFNQKPERKEYLIKWRQSSGGKQYQKEYHELYYQSLNHKLAKMQTVHKYQHTPKGRGTAARVRARRRAYSTNPLAFGARVELLHLMKESCILCGKPYAATHEIDHILPLFKGGTDDWDNLQSLCYQCHRIKSGQELKNRRVS